MSTYKTYIKGWPTEPGTYDISEILDVKPGISINLTSSRFVYNEKFPEGKLKSNVIGILLSMKFPTDYVWKGFPTNKELFYNHVLGNYNNSPQYFVDKVLQITDEIFPAEKFSNSVLDMSQVIEHKKSHRIRVRVLAGAICGYYMSKKLNWDFPFVLYLIPII